MRKRQTFLITVLTSETENTTICGQIKVISTGEVNKFTTMDELNHLITLAMEQHTTAEKTVYHAQQQTAQNRETHSPE
jgi:hypothetical protein